MTQGPAVKRWQSERSRPAGRRRGGGSSRIALSDVTRPECIATLISTSVPYTHRKRNLPSSRGAERSTAIRWPACMHTHTRRNVDKQQRPTQLHGRYRREACAENEILVTGLYSAAVAVPHTINNVVQCRH